MAKSNGCCPAVVFECVKVSNFTASATSIHLSSGERILFSGNLSAKIGGQAAWKISVAGRVFTGSGNSISSVFWDGRDDSGRQVAPGTYTAKLEARTSGGCSGVDVKTIPISVTAAPEQCLNPEFGSSANLGSGSLRHSQILFSLPGDKFFREFTLSYNSLDGSQTPLGTGWTHSGNIQLAENNNGSYTLTEGDGSRIVLYKRGELFSPQTSPYPALAKNDDGTYLLIHKSGIKYSFSPEKKILRLEDRNGNAVLFAYEANGNLAAMASPSGRQAAFSYDESKRIASVIDPNGNTHSFAYQGNNLASILTRTPGGEVSGWSYTYDEKGFLLSKTDPLGFKTSYVYDEDHRVTQSTDPEGKTRSMAYDPENGISRLTEKDGGIWTYRYDPAKGVLIEKTNPLGGRSASQYDGSRNLIAQTDPNGNTTSYAYDGNGNVLSSQDALGNTTSFTYNDLNLVTGITDALGNAIQLSYDARGNLLSMTDAQGATTQYDYDFKGNVALLTNANGKAAKLAYDGFALASVTDPVGAVTRIAYDGAGNPAGLTDALGYITRFEYDSRNRLLKRTDALENVTRLAYDAGGNHRSITDALGNTTSFAYNDRGQVVQRTDARGYITALTYGSGCPSCGPGVDRMTSLTDPNGNITSYRYDLAGRLVQETDPLGNATRYDYDQSGNVIARTGGKGDTVRYAYDALNRLTGKLYPDGSRSDFRYDAVGSLVSASNLHVSYDFSYDKNRRVVRVNSSQGFSLEYRYDALGNRTGMLSPYRWQADYLYDEANRLKTLNTWLGSFDFTYDALGRRKDETYPNGYKASHSYDEVGRIKELSHAAYGRVASRFAYTYDPVGNRLSEKTLRGSRGYEYDALGQLVRATDGPKEGRFEYDGSGNRLREEKKGKTIRYAHGPGNQIREMDDVVFGYDANGNRVKRIGPRGETGYEYDFENRLKQVTLPNGRRFGYTYDPFGRRIGKDGTLYGYPREMGFFYDGPNVIFPYSYGYPDAILVHDLAVDRPLAIMEENLLFYHRDGLGSTRMLTYDWGYTADRYEYDGFGEILERRESFPILYTFTGREYDEETGLYYYRARYYDPESGRFLTRDPIGFAGGDANLYRYVGNNPVNYSDPSGLLAPPWHHWITYRAARNSGYGIWDSLKLAWSVILQDHNALDKSAHASNIHAMAGILQNGEPQTCEQAIAAAKSIIISRFLPSAIHAGQDLPGHRGESMENFGWNWSTALHIFRDIFPSPTTVGKAYQNTMDIFIARGFHLSNGRGQ